MLTQLDERIFNLTLDKLCSICHDDENLISKENVFVTKKCGHIFHINCCKTHIESTESCPLCNTKQNIDETINWNTFKKFYESKHYNEFKRLGKYFTNGKCEHYSECEDTINCKHFDDYGKCNCYDGDNIMVVDWTKISKKISKDVDYVSKDFYETFNEYIDANNLISNDYERLIQYHSGLQVLTFST